MAFLKPKLIASWHSSQGSWDKKTEHEDRFSHDRALMHNFLGIDSGNTIGFFI